MSKTLLTFLQGARRMIPQSVIERLRGTSLGDRLAGAAAQSRQRLTQKRLSLAAGFSARLHEALTSPPQSRRRAMDRLFKTSSLDEFFAFYTCGPTAPHYSMPWGGRAMTKLPADFAVYPALLAEKRPMVLIEIGAQRGVSSQFFQSILSAWEGQVLSIDINLPDELSEMQKAGVQFILGDATSAQTARQVIDLVGNRPAMVIDDGSHNHHDVLAAARLYSSLVPVGGSYVIEDAFTIRVNEGGVEADALDAIDIFLSEHPEFERDRRFDRFLLTSACLGFLTRLR